MIYSIKFRKKNFLFPQIYNCYCLLDSWPILQIFFKKLFSPSFVSNLPK